MQQIGEQHTAHLAVMSVIWTGVVNHPFAVLARDDHRMILRVGLQHPIKNQITRPRQPQIPTEQVSVVVVQSFGVGKLGECPIIEVSKLEGASAGAEQVCSQQCVRIAPLLNRWKRRHEAGRELGIPAIVMKPERFAVRVPNEGCAVGYLSRKLSRRCVCRAVSDCGEPSAESTAVFCGVETHPIRRSVRRISAVQRQDCDYTALAATIADRESQLARTHWGVNIESHLISIRLPEMSGSPERAFDT